MDVNVTIKQASPQSLYVPIGIRGENEATRVLIDATPLVEEYGPGTPTLLVKRPTDTSAYPVITTMEDNVVIWEVTDTDTAFAGFGSFELYWYVGDILAKTIVWQARVINDIGDSSETPPEPYQSWVDSVIEAGTEAYQSARDAEAAQRGAEAAQTATESALAPLSETVNSVIIQPSKNIANPSGAVVGAILSDGTIDSDATYRTSDYIDIEALTGYITKNIGYVGLYESDNTFSRRLTMTNTKTFTSLATEVKCRVCTKSTDTSIWRLNKGAEVDDQPYRPYYSLDSDVDLSAFDDTTLAVAGKFADAKAVGDRFKTETITDPYKLTWSYGEVSASGNLTYNDKGVISYSPIHVEAGSFVSISSGNKFNAYITYDDGTTGYKSYNTAALTVSKSGVMRLGVGNSGSTSINNMSVLDTLTINLIVKNENAPASPFIRTGNMIGIVPVNDYVGQHTDVSGFDQTTDYDTAIAEWRALPSDAPDYITETDLGAIYENGPHQFKYTLTPPNRSVSGKSLPRVFIVTSLHGHEKSATYGLMYLIKDMLAHSMDDPVLFYLRNFVRFTILPMANPYGWNANSSLGTHGGIRQNENGVNLNRNFGVSTWADFDDDPAYTTPGEYNYRGTGPFSEKETQNIKSALIATHNDIALLLDIHTYGTDTTTAISITYVSANKDNSEAMKNIAVSFDQYLCGIKNHMDELYGVDLGLSQVYGSSTLDTDVNMTLQDYGYNACVVPSVTLEVPCGSTNGFLGDYLSKYSADTIKLCGEIIGNYLCKALWYLERSAT